MKMNMKMISPRLSPKYMKSPKRNILYKKIKINIPIRLDVWGFICYTITVAGACVQALGTFVV